MYRVLIVDDEPFVIEGMKTAIDWTGFNFEISGEQSGRSADHGYIHAPDGWTGIDSKSA